MPEDLQAELLKVSLEISKNLGDMNARIVNIEKAVSGNGQPGLAQKVDQLEESKNRLWGAGILATILLSVFEWLMNRRGP